MKTITLSDTTRAENLTEIANEACNILNNDLTPNDSISFDVDGENIIEYDNEKEESIIWIIDTVSWNEDGTASHVNLDC